MVVTHRRGTAPHPIILVLCILLALAAPVTAATTELHVVRHAADGVTVLEETTVDYTWLEQNLPVQGDGRTHYYHQGPVFEGDPWNPEEDVNVIEKDMGAVKGTDLADICDLVGGMREGETVRIRAADGMSREFPYRNVYEPEPRQGPMVITWYKADEGYVPDYYSGMRLVFFADTSSNPDGLHAFGVWDMHECFDSDYWYFFQPGLPTTTGLSVQYVSDVIIYSDEEPTGSIHVNSTPSGAAVFIDDEETGDVTPCTLSGIELGSYSVRVEKEGFIPSDEEWVNVVANAVAEVEFNLIPETESGGGSSSGDGGGGGSRNGSIAITSVPMNASIYLDGNATEFRTDATLEDVPPGEHTIELVLPGYWNITRTVTVEKAECTLLDLIFENSTTGEATTKTGRIAVFSVPTNASIYLDGKDTGSRTNATLQAVPVGEHTIELVLPGYWNITRTVTVAEAERSTIDVILSPSGGKTETNTTTGNDGTAATRPTPAQKNPLEAFIATILNILTGIFPFFGTGEDLPTTPGPESTPDPGEDSATPVLTSTPMVPVPTPDDTRSVKNHSGGIYVTSHPPGMTIVVDNRRQIWQTPRIVYGLREGLHSIRVEKSESDRSGEDSSFQFETVQTWVYPDTITPVHLDGVTPSYKKTIRIDSETCRGEKFTMSGSFPAATIPDDAEIEGAKSWVTVSRDGVYHSFAIPYGIGAGRTFWIEPEDADTVPISINSNPEDAAVFIDGFPTGKCTPCRVEGLSPGQHRILVSKPGYITAEDVITIPEGARTGGAVTCTLREYIDGDLLVESTIPDARIYLYGRYTGEKTPHTFTGMSIGTYEVRVVTENDSKTIEDVLVKPGETTRCLVNLKEDNS
ncbi:PEGA domain-containing protein [Methanoculleus sp. YWC-01]|uniref:PEGA domain-containing protein n=1 Tax=Methanoculleus nereidis TaxID=2735141 RepID=A0ABU3Z3J5_9EURY|nr:PEGA domain-containing protein [Methanoculleus sp. YWC-01]MDV4343385.1 PEGA domain-containing protein [Methanoculleus sp. YWC-01]